MYFKKKHEDYSVEKILKNVENTKFSENLNYFHTCQINSSIPNKEILYARLNDPQIKRLRKYMNQILLLIAKIRPTPLEKLMVLLREYELEAYSDIALRIYQKFDGKMTPNSKIGAIIYLLHQVNPKMKLTQKILGKKLNITETSLRNCAKKIKLNMKTPTFVRKVGQDVIFTREIC